LSVSINEEQIKEELNVEGDRLNCELIMMSALRFL